MSQKSDDSIERFFRKAVVQQDKTFMERDWHNMEKMLDAQAVTSAAQHAGKVRGAIKTAALVIVVASLFIIGAETQTDPGSVQMQAAVGTVGPHIEVKTENPTADLHPSAVSCDESKVEKAANAVVPASNLARSEDRKTTISNQKIVPIQGMSVRQSSTKVERVFAIKDQKSEQYKGEIVHDQPIAAADGPALTKLTSDPSVVPAMEKQVTDEIKTDSIAETKESKDESLTIPEKENELLTLAKPKIIVTGLISPDFSTTSLTKYSKPSGVFGVLVGYRISKRFTVMTGVTKSLKKYEGYGEEYSPPEGYWQNRTNGVVPDEVEGKCGIIEVPLMLQFDILQRSKSRIFLSSGVSSYFMTSENYQYTFKDPNPGAANSWTAKEPTQYLFKIGHLSAGYDRAIGRNFSVGIEPFLKVPFEGIGWTDINLYSTGAYINLRYTILQTQQ